MVRRRREQGVLRSANGLLVNFCARCRILICLLGSLFNFYYFKSQMGVPLSVPLPTAQCPNAATITGRINNPHPPPIVTTDESYDAMDAIYEHPPSRRLLQKLGWDVRKR